MRNEYWFYPGKLLLFLSEDLIFTLKYHTCPFDWLEKKLKFANSSIYDVVSDTTFGKLLHILMRST